MGVIAKITSFFSGFKIFAILGSAIGALLFMNKLKGDKIEDLEEENIMHQKKDHITDEMNKAIKEAEAEEDEATKDIDTSDWRNKLNKLHNDKT